MQRLIENMQNKFSKMAHSYAPGPYFSMNYCFFCSEYVQVVNRAEEIAEAVRRGGL